MSTTPIQLPDVEPPKYYSPLDARAKLLNLQNLAQEQQVRQQQLQMGQMDIGEKQRAIAQRQAIDQAFKNAWKLDENGKPQLDENGRPQFDDAKFSQVLSAAGFGSAGTPILEANTKYRTSLTDLEKKRGEVAELEDNAAGHLAAGVQAGNNDPHLFLTHLAQAGHSGAITPAHAKALTDPVIAALAQDPTGESARGLVKQITDQMIARSPKERELANQTLTAQSTAAHNRAQTASTELGTLEKEMGIATRTMPTPDPQTGAIDPQQWTSWRSQFSPAVQAKIPSVPSPPAVTAVKGFEPPTERKTALEADELQRKLDMVKNTKPSDVMALVDQVVPPDVKANRALNLRTKVMVSAKLNQGDFAGAQDVIKTAAAEMRQLEVATDPRVQQGKINVAIQGAAGRAAAIADASGLTEDDYQRAGQQYGMTGVMPSIGRDSVSRGRIEHASQQWARDNGFSPADIVTMRAAYAGDKESLKNFQKQRDQIVSFEQTAQKNLDLFINAASKIPDTGVPWLNTPLRDLNEKLIGSANMAAVNAARNVANNEIAKVTSGGGLSGVVSDANRHEVQAYNPKNATFAQTLAVAKILRADMANRHGSMDATLSEIKDHIRGLGGGGTKPETAKDPLGIR